MEQLQIFQNLSYYSVVINASLLALLFAYIWISSGNEAIPDYEIPCPEQLEHDWQGAVLDQPSLKISGSSAIQCYCPATGKSLGIVNPSTPDGIDRAIAKAHEAQVEWAKTTFNERRRVLKTLLKFILKNQDSIADAACLDSGKTRIDASFGEILVTAEKLKWTINHGERALKPEGRPTNFLMMYKINEVRWEPLGVVAACVSWNYPFHNLVGPIISAIFAGNGIIVKGSENTAWSSSYFINIVKGALTACGHSPNLVQSVLCWPAVAPHLTSHPKISHLTFIGSRAVAHDVCTSAAKALTPVCVELGGKDAAFILDDAIPDLDRIVDILMRGTFQAAGQNCIGIERIIALPKVYPRLVERLAPLIRSLRVGSVLDSPNGEGIDMGASISDASFARLEELIDEAVSEGAKLLAGGSRLRHQDHPKGHFFSPTLLIDVTPSMRIAQTELFAPICVLMRADSVSQAVDIANSSSYGLGCSVFGSDQTAIDFVVDRVRVGMVAVNDFGAYYAVQLPFGGVKGSGYGRFAGEEGLRSLCNTKAVCRDRWPALMRTTIPKPLVYPIESAKRGWEVCCGVVQLGYGLSIAQRVAGLRNIVGL